MTKTLEPPRFARFELAYLLAGRTDAHAARSREIVGIPEVESSDDLIYQAGLAGLITRGLLVADGEGVMPRNEAGLAGLILGTASQWISMAVRTSTLIDVSLLVQGVRGSVLIRQAPGGTFDLVFIKPGESIADVAVTLAEKMFADNAELALMVRTADLETDAALFLQHSDASGWQLGIDPVFPDDENWPAADLVPTPSTQQGVIDALRELVDRHRIAA